MKKATRFITLWIYPLGFLSALLVVSGLPDQRVAAAEQIALEGTNWQLVRMIVLGGFEFAPEDRSKYRLNFRSENRLTGTSDCNTLGGLWLQEGTTLDFSPFYSSNNLCPPGSLHNNLLLNLRDVQAHQFRDGHLIMTTSTAGIMLEFELRE
jgi:heat shock protein HslJ